MSFASILCLLAGLVGIVEARYAGRVWTYQSTSRVYDAMGMGYGTSFSMIGRGRIDMATGKQDIYKTKVLGVNTEFPSTIWVGSCVYESDDDGFVRCITRKTPVYNIDTNLPVCTFDADQTVLNPDPFCDNIYYHNYKGPYDPADTGNPAKQQDMQGDKYGAVLSMAGDLELGRVLAVGAPKTHNFPYDSDPRVDWYATYGAVYTYTGEYKHWTEHQRLTADDANVQLTVNIPDFGAHVEIDRVTSRTMMVTCPQCVITDREEGSVYVFKTEDGKLWSNTQQLMCDDATTDTWQFSRNIRLYDDFALISAAALNLRGAAYIFREERHSTHMGGIFNGLWTQQQRLIPTDAAVRSSGILYGEKMDLHGKTLVITQNEETTYGAYSGM
jgi:hypothetical protein